MFDRKKPNFVVNISGGAGKNVMFSGVAKNIKKSYPEHNLIVISPYPELLINLPFIDRVYRAGQCPYFYEDFLKDNEESRAYSVEPYQDNGYLMEREHLIETWSGMVGAVKELSLPKIEINIREINYFRNKFSNILLTGKPILVVQPFGGGPQLEMKYNWNRDIPPNQINEICDILSEKYNIIQVGREDQIKVRSAKLFSGPLREICCLLKLSDKRLLIDSFCQHAAAALDLPSTVCWITNKPKVFGYEMHSNILAKNFSVFTHKIDSLFQDQNWDGSWSHYYPYENEEVFDINNILREF